MTMTHTLGAGSTNAPAPPASLGALVAYADQLDAASRDVNAAWEGFLNGGETAAATPERSAARHDRVDAVSDTLSESIVRLVNLAAEIRART